MAACTAQASEENILNTVELLLSRNADPNLTCRYQNPHICEYSPKFNIIIQRRVYRCSCCWLRSSVHTYNFTAVCKRKD